MASRKKIELSDELKELVKTKIAVLPKDQFAAFEKYIVQLKKDRAKAEKELPSLLVQMEALGYKITKPGEEKLEPVPAVEALKEVVKPAEAKKEEEKKPAAKGFL